MEDEVMDEEREIASEYEVYAGGGMITHQFDDSGNHRLVDWNDRPGAWAGYAHVAVLNIDGYMYVGVTPYGLFENVDESVYRVEILSKKS